MSVEINNESDVAISEEALQQLAQFVLRELHVHPETEVGVLFVDEGAMEQLHRQWMNEPGSTDVLSFPMDELRPGRLDSPSPAGMLGDVVICPHVAARQADAAGHSLQQEVHLLLTHGMLHLLGFDHSSPLEEAEMFGLQRDLLRMFAKTEKPA